MVGLLMVTISLWSKTWVVDTFGYEGDSLQTAVDSAYKYRFDGIDTVLVQDGKYHLFINDTVGLIMQDSVILMSVNGAERCTLTAVSASGEDTAWHVIYCSFGNTSSHAAVIKGFTITGGNARKSSLPHNHGGGICCAGASPVIIDNIIVNNFAIVSCGGINVHASSAPIIKNNIIINNRAEQNAGGIGIWNYSSATLIGNEIKENTCVLADGGGVSLGGYTYTVWRKNIISHNYSPRWGGGIYMANSASAVIESTVIAYNSGLYGGGVYVWQDSRLEIKHSVIISNKGDTGGSFYIDDGGRVIVDSCLIIDNGAQEVHSGCAYITSTGDSLSCSYSNLYYNTFQTDTEIVNYSGNTIDLTDDFWWVTTDAEISALIYGLNNHSSFYTDFVPSTPGEPISIDSVRNYNEDYTSLVSYCANAPGTLYIRVWGEDRTPYIREACVIVLRSNIYTDGIAVSLLETDTNSGIYEGEAYILEVTGNDTQRIDDIYQRIRVDTAWDIIEIIANVDTTKKYQVYYKLQPAEIELSDTVHDFGTLMIGDSAIWDSLWIKNLSSDVNLTVDSAKTSCADFRVITLFPQVVSPNDSIKVSIKFKPLNGGYIEDNLRIFSNDQDEPISYVQLKGSGFIALEPFIVLADTFHDYGNVKPGRTEEWTLTIENQGSETLKVDSIKSTNLVFKCDTNWFTLPPLINIGVNISFTPPDTGQYSGWIYIYSNDPDDSISSVYLCGNGFAPYISVSDTFYNFGDIVVDSSIYCSLYIYNLGNDTLDIIDILCTNDAFEVISPSTPLLILPKDSTKLIVKFSAGSDTGEYKSELKIYSNDPLHSVVVIHLVAHVYGICEQLPFEFSCAVSPNPFTQTTVIKYKLPKKTHVKIQIYDLTGRRVTKLIDEIQLSGTYTLKWEGCDKSCKPLPSGIYYLLFGVNKSKIIKKVVLMR